jgi:signal peptidase I
MWRAEPARRRRSVHPVLELLLSLAAALGLAFLVQAFLIRPYQIPSVSMYPTLRVGQRILVDRLTTHPRVGEVDVFHPPAGATPPGDRPARCGDPREGRDETRPCDRGTPRPSGETFVKRVVGGPGDTLRITGGHVWRDGVEEHGAFIRPCDEGPGVCTFPGTITVPAGDYYMMGDNRGDSDDSRFWGPVPQRWIIGVAFLTYWPPDRIGSL